MAEDSKKVNFIYKKNDVDCMIICCFESKFITADIHYKLYNYWLGLIDKTLKS